MVDSPWLYGNFKESKRWQVFNRHVFIVRTKYCWVVQDINVSADIA